MLYIKGYQNITCVSPAFFVGKPVFFLLEDKLDLVKTISHLWSYFHLSKEELINQVSIRGQEKLISIQPYLVI